jgi:hypothetical protein
MQIAFNSCCQRSVLKKNFNNFESFNFLSDGIFQVKIRQFWIFLHLKHFPNQICVLNP